MFIIETSTGTKHEVEIKHVESSDFKNIGKKRYYFDWNVERHYELFKLSLVKSNDILGLLSIEKFHDEWRIHIRLLTVSKENKGTEKAYDRIAGNLIMFASRLAVQDFAELACVSLRPKSDIAQHYIEKYKMKSTGLTLSIEAPEIFHLINEYNHD